MNFKLFAFTLLMFPLAAIAQDFGTGTGWTGLQPTESLVIDENFQGFEFFHTDEHSNQGNSEHKIDETTLEEIPGYIDFDSTFSFLNSTVTASYSFIQCAFAPNWGVAYSINGDTGEPVDPDPTTEGVSVGFVEISRLDEIYSAVPTSRGYLTVDLTNLEFVEAIQYSHSSTGGNRRGILVEYSKDGGASWDSLRYQPGNNYAASFTTDVFTGDRTPNSINCTPSANGMLWEDAINDDGLMIRFLEAGGQTVRLHDLKVYGSLPSISSNSLLEKNKLKIVGKSLIMNEQSMVQVYTVSGALITKRAAVKKMDLSHLENGVYILKVNSKGVDFSQKIVIR